MFNGHIARFRFLGLILLTLIWNAHAAGQVTAFTYQGQLSDNSAPANGNFDLQFSLFDLVQNGTQQGLTITQTNVSVANGVFTVQLDFGSNVFTGNGAQFMQIGVRPGGTIVGFTDLSPRLPLTPMPYSIRTLSAATADTATTATVAATANSATNAAQLGGIQANQYVLTTDSRLDAANYVQNGTAQQITTNFNISGNGTLGGTLSANAVNAATQYNIGGNAALVASVGNTIVGLQTAAAGNSNTIVGFQSGQTNTGNNNTFIGRSAGQVNSGQQNTFVGVSTGTANTTAGFNSFFGSGAGNRNIDGSSNSFFGADSGVSNTSGAFNSFFGTAAGNHGTTGSSNTFVGNSAGLLNTTGSNNTFIGASAGSAIGTTNLTQSAAIGANAVVSTNNTIVLGTNTETTNIPGKLTVSGLTVFSTLGAAGSTTLCRNASNQLAACSSSLRYKTNLTPYRRGMDIIDHLNPIAFTWKDGGMRDLGFGAEDVAKIEPLLVTYNAQGQVEGLKYDRITVALVNAIKEQQTQISDQRQQIESLKRLVCADHPGADVCKQN